MTGPRFQVIDGEKDKRTVVCPWCAKTFLTRGDLDEHWASDPRCKANARVNNPTQTKYMEALDDEQPSGE